MAWGPRLYFCIRTLAFMPYEPFASNGASRGASPGVATLKVRQGAFDALNDGSGALGEVK